MLYRSIFLCGILLGAVAVHGQLVAISDGETSMCDGFIIDSGLQASSYSPGENFTFTVCPLEPEITVNLYFTFFNLGAGDTLTIYNGDPADGFLIGVFAESDLQTQDISSTSTDGTATCLTLVWETDDDPDTVGDFSAEVSCGPPCDRPIPFVTYDGEQPWLVCQDEVLEMDASGTYVGQNTDIASFTWYFGDGTTNSTDWPLVSHAYAEPGAYQVNLELEDSNGCTNSQVLDMYVYVSTEPNFGNTPDEIHVCLGADAGLEAEVEGNTFESLPTADLGGFLWIPDIEGECFSDSLTFLGFAPFETIDDTTDIESLFINFEHSFMGDLQITFECPNGQSMAVHQQGGGGTYLGEPIDGTSDDPSAFGVGYDYYWVPDPASGQTWEEASATAGGTLDSGEYASNDPFENLLGCPLNGTWVIEICDLWGIDDGFIFDWGIFFEPSLYPEPIVFTPEYLPDCANTYWESPLPLEFEALCNGIDVTSSVTFDITETGTFPATFHATDSHGCEYQHTTDIIVSQHQVDAGTDQEFCFDPVPLQATVTPGDAFFSQYEYSWDPDQFLSASDVASPEVTLEGGNVVFTVTTWPTGFPECAASDEVTVDQINPAPITASVPAFQTDCPGEAVEISFTPAGGYGELSYSWSDGLGSGTSANVSPSVTTSYTIAISDECGQTETIAVAVDVSNPGETLDTEPVEICLGGESGTLVVSGGDGNYTYNQDIELVLLDTGEGYAVSATEIGSFEVYVEDGCIANGVVEVEVTPCDVELFNIFTPDGTGMNDVFWVEGLRFFPGSRLTVFNRWGNTVYESEDYKNDWRMEDLSDGTYYYILEVLKPDGTIQDYSGDVTIIAGK